MPPKKKKRKYRGKQIGNAFEALVVKGIRKAINKKYSDELCYRTPGSGGHYIIGGADIVIKPKLRKIFDFDIECKHQKTIKIHSFFETTKQFQNFMSQCLENCFENGGNPLLVFRGRRTPIFAASTIDALTDAGYIELTKHAIPGLHLRFRGKVWKIFLWKFMLKELKFKV